MPYSSVRAGGVLAVLTLLAPVLWLGLGAGAEYWGVAGYYGQSFDWIVFGACVFVTAAIYFFNRFFDKADLYNRPDQANLLTPNLWVAWISPIVCVGVVLVLGFTGHRFGWFLALSILGIAYSYKWAPPIPGSAQTKSSLRDVFILKNVLVSSLWGISPFVIVYQQSPVKITIADTLVLALALILSALWNNLACDLRDKTGDSFENLRTVATRWGSGAVRLLIVGMFFAGNAAMALLSAVHAIPAEIALFFLGVTVYTMLVSLPYLMEQRKLPRWFTETLIDSQAIVCGAGLVLLARISAA